MDAANEDNPEPSLTKGTIVQITGLTSSAGRPLNGAFGLVASEPTSNNNSSKKIGSFFRRSSSKDDLRRYPVLIYALQQERGGNNDEPQHEIIKTRVVTPKSIKAQNLIVVPEQRQKLFQQVVKVQCQLAHDSNDHPGALLWYEAYYDRWPDGDKEIGIILTYIELLARFTKQPRKALEAMDHVRPSIESGGTTMNASMRDQFLVMYVEICCAAGERIDEAFEEALKINADTEQGKMLTVRALGFLLQYCYERNETDLTRENPDLLDLQVQVAQRIYDLAPDNVDNLFNLGAAHCLKGDYLEGSRCYRRAIATGGGDPSKKRYREENLIVAQLQCPGMPLEDYIILFDNGRVASCIKKADKEYCKLAITRRGFGVQDGSMQVNGNDVDLLQFPLPSSPDDPDVFPRSFLDTLE